MANARSSSVLAGLISPLLLSLVLQGCTPPKDLPPDENAVCGDAILDEGEQCDDGNLDEGDGCSAACELEEGRSEEESRAINEYVVSLGKLTVQDPTIEVIDEQPEQPSVSPSGEIFCSSRTFHEIKLFDRFPSQGAVADRIYPGALLDGNSIAAGIFNEIPLPKKPLTVSIDLPQQTVSTVMENPSLSSFLDAQQELILAGIAERPEGQLVPPKFVKVDRLATINEDQLSLTLGFQVNAGVATNVDVAGQFNFNDTQKRSRYLVRIVNELYTMAIDKPAFASDFLADSVSLDAVRSAFQSGNPPVYVDTVTYGRIIYVAVESSFSATELEAALQAAVSGVGFDAELEFGVTSQQVLQEATIRAVAVGPAPGDQVDLGALEGLEDLEALSRIATREASVTGEFFGEPIFFTVAYLADNTQTLSSVEGVYTAESCRPAPEETTRSFRVQVNQMIIDEIIDSGSTPNRAEMRGTISVSFGGQTVFLFNRAPGQEVDLFEGPVSSSSSFFLSGNLNDVDIQPGSTISGQIALVENDVTNSDDVHSLSFSIPIEDVLNGQGRVDFNFDNNGALGDGTFTGSLFIGFQPL